MATIPEMLKQKLKVQTLAKPKEGGGRETAGNLAMKDILAIAKERGGSEAIVTQVLGTCVSCGVTVDNKDPKEIIREIKAGTIKI